MKVLFRLTSVCTALALTMTPFVATAGQDDDAPFSGDGKTRNAVDPIYFGRNLADFPMHAEQQTGLRVLPPTGTELFAGQRFDLRVESQIPAKQSPRLVNITVNGKNFTEEFNRRISQQGTGPESGTPPSELLFGASARNLSFDQPGRYVVQATVQIDGVERRIQNQYNVAPAPNPAAPDAARKLVFFLGDGVGLPMWTAARIVGKGTLSRSISARNFFSRGRPLASLGNSIRPSLISPSMRSREYRQPVLDGGRNSVRVAGSTIA